MFPKEFILRRCQSWIVIFTVAVFNSSASHLQLRQKVSLSAIKQCIVIMPVVIQMEIIWKDNLSWFFFLQIFPLVSDNVARDLIELSRVWFLDRSSPKASYKTYFGVVKSNQHPVHVSLWTEKLLLWLVRLSCNCLIPLCPDTHTTAVLHLFESLFPVFLQVIAAFEVVLLHGGDLMTFGIYRNWLAYYRSCEQLLGGFHIYGSDGFMLIMLRASESGFYSFSSRFLPPIKEELWSRAFMF